MFPLLDSTTFEQAASLIVNPFTVVGFIEIIRQGNHKAVAINAAASAIGKIIIRWGKKFNVPVISLVNRQEQVDILHRLGAEHVFNTSDEEWKHKAKVLSESLEASIGFDCVGGIGTSELGEILINEGVVCVHGTLSNEFPKFNYSLLGIQKKKLEGFNMPVWLYEKNSEEILQVSNFVQENLDVLRLSTLKK